MLRQPRAALTRRRWIPRAPCGLRGHGLGRFSRLVQAWQKQQQLRGIEPFALRAKELADEQIELLPQERILFFRRREPRGQRLVFGE